MRRCRCPGADRPLGYKVDGSGGLRIVSLDSLTAVYHRPSGQTHVVSEPVPEILDALCAGEAEIPELLERLTLRDTQINRAILEERLHELVAAGLIAQR